MTTVDVNDLETAMTLTDAGTGAEAWVCRDTGAVLIRSDEVGEPAGPVPADVDDGDRYVPVPSARDLHLGQALVFDFVRAEIPSEYDAVREIFRRPGAYGRYSRLLDGLGLRDRWHQYRDERTRAALNAWCDDNGFTLAGLPA
ncbi:hypothetical protein [Telluria beijingensis]|uniref:hypothetical protein n=1 Tax=Telluria beijingensis TaxID=3068633 RepID=UPI002795A752|nr:hypothetical protein [Massilia sp. REN29]